MAHIASFLAEMNQFLVPPKPFLYPQSPLWLRFAFPLGVPTLLRQHRPHLNSTRRQSLGASDNVSFPHFSTVGTRGKEPLEDM